MATVTHRAAVDQGPGRRRVRQHPRREQLAVEHRVGVRVGVPGGVQAQHIQRDERVDEDSEPGQAGERERREEPALHRIPPGGGRLAHRVVHEATRSSVVFCGTPLRRCTRTFHSRTPVQSELGWSRRCAMDR